MSQNPEFLWYIPNQADTGHRRELVAVDLNSLEKLTEQARALEDHGWDGALIGTGWGRPDTFTLATAQTAQTRTFEPPIAIRPGYWRPANFASAAARSIISWAGACASISSRGRTISPPMATERAIRPSAMGARNGQGAGRKLARPSSRPRGGAAAPSRPAGARRCA